MMLVLQSKQFHPCLQPFPLMEKGWKLGSKTWRWFAMLWSRRPIYRCPKTGEATVHALCQLTRWSGSSRTSGENFWPSISVILVTARDLVRFSILHASFHSAFPSPSLPYLSPQTGTTLIIRFRPFGNSRPNTKRLVVSTCPRSWTVWAVTGKSTNCLPKVRVLMDPLWLDERSL